MICDGSCSPQCYGCTMRDKGLQVSPAATPSRHNRVPYTDNRSPSWEKGVVTETRCDGSKMPLLEPGTRAPLHVKQYGEQRRDIDDQVRNLKSRTSPLPDAH